ncbi:hypothetical protein Hanom_Chr06g00497101 [Helianthus anomalus]
MGVVPIPSSSGDEPPSTPPPSVIVLIVEMSPFATKRILWTPHSNVTVRLKKIIF